MPPPAQPQALISCTVCGDQIGPSSPRSTISSSTVCGPCTRKLFNHAIAHEANFPPRWGSAVLDPKDFASVLGSAFLEEHKAVEREFTCPIPERVYCHGWKDGVKKGEICSRFLGNWGEMRGRMEFVCCKGCAWLTCLGCGECFDLGEGEVGVKHVCKEKNKGKGRKGDGDMFGKLKRGREYQVCPNGGCRRVVELADGCNHVACPCGENYCFICAKPAEEDSHHWRVGGCPRYGQPGSSTALYNDDIRLADDDAESDVEDEDLWRWQMGMLMGQEGPEDRAARRRARRRGRDREGDAAPMLPGEQDQRGRGNRRQYRNDRGGMGNRTTVAGGHEVPVPVRPLARGIMEPPPPRRGLRQIIHERGRELLHRFRL